MSDEILSSAKRTMQLTGLLLIILMAVIGAYQMFNFVPPYLRVVRLECPYCNETSTFGVTRHNPAGVSHSEIKYCAKCYHNFYVTVYYDGVVSVRQ